VVGELGTQKGVGGVALGDRWMRIRMIDKHDCALGLA
jgi:hypothetical protein